MIFLILLILCFLFKMSNNFKILSVEPASDFQKLIQPPLNQSMVWLGGDSSASVPLEFGEDQYSVWMYGDTILGSIDETGKRNMTYFIANTVGVTKNGVSDHIDLFWRTTPDIEAMFIPDDYPTKIKFWLMSAFAKKNDDGSYYIYFFTPRVNLSAKFIEYNGESVIKCLITSENVENPIEWEYTQSQIPFSISSEKNGWSWGIASVVLLDDYVYLSGQLVKDVHMYFSRIPIEDFEDLKWESLEYFQGGDTWGTDISKIKPIEGLDETPETTFSYCPYLKKWVMITNQFLSFDAYLYTSDALTGPYTKTLVYKVPAPFSTTKDVFCYAFKVHHEYTKFDEKDNRVEMIFTYNCNSFQFFTDYSKMNELYIPQFVRITFQM